MNIQFKELSMTMMGLNWNFSIRRGPIYRTFRSAGNLKDGLESILSKEEHASDENKKLVKEFMLICAEMNWDAGALAKEFAGCRNI